MGVVEALVLLVFLVISGGTGRPQGDGKPLFLLLWPLSEVEQCQ